MMPFLLDDIARMKHDDLQREAAALERASEATRRTPGRRQPQRLRVRAGTLFVTLGSWLLGSGGAISPMRLENAQ